MTEAISLGWNCESAIRGVRDGLRNTRNNGYQTCPFDECITNYDGIILCIKDDFKYFCDPNYLELITAPFSTGGIVKSERLIYNKRYNFIFNHESPDHANLHIIQKWANGKDHYIKNNYKLFIERYERRINNFRLYINNLKMKITFIIGKYNPDITELEHIIKDKYPNLQFNIIQYMPSVPLLMFNEHHELMRTI